VSRSFKDIIAGTYFGRLFQADKFIFLVIFLFFAGSVGANLMRLQTSPFFIWDMYSRRVDTAQTYRLLEIGYNGNKWVNLRHSWNEPEKTILNMPLRNYLDIRDHHGADPFGVYLRSYWLKKHPAFAAVAGQLYNTPLELDEFPGWYRRWLSAVVGEPVEKVVVLEKKLAFSADGGLREISSDTVLVIR
jgi:hypothetical protein